MRSSGPGSTANSSQTPNITQHHQFQFMLSLPEAYSSRAWALGSYIFTVEQPTDYRRGNISTSAYGVGLTLLVHVHGTDSTEELGKKKVNKSGTWKANCALQWLCAFCYLSHLNACLWRRPIRISLMCVLTKMYASLHLCLTCYLVICVTPWDQEISVIFLLLF